MSTGVVATVRSLLSRLFPERQFYHRSHGEVRFISLSARNQVGLVIVSLAFLMWVAFASVNVVFKDQIINSTERRLKATQVEYEVRMSDMQSAYDELNGLLLLAQERFEETTKELEAKHRQLDSFTTRQASVRNNFGDLRNRLSEHAAIGKKDEPKNTLLMQATDLEPTRRVSRMGLNDQNTNLTHVSHVMKSVSNGRLNLHQETAQVSEKVSKLDDRITQLNFERSEQMARLEEETGRSIEQFESYINTTDLDLERVLSRFEPAETAVGGPLITLQNPSDAVQLQDLDEYKRQLYRIDIKLARLSNLESALSSMPLAMPTDENIRFSSPFGGRRDPFTRKLAMHSGLDIAGPRRSPIFATASGKVVHASNKGPYGKMVEIDHGHGFRTRFGHLYRIEVNKGDNVDFGETIGLLGSSGRANGPHVHYEVWFEGKVRDPQNFIEAGRHVLKS